MKRLTLFLMCVMASLALTAQNTRLVKGLVFSEEDIPMQGVTLSVVGMNGTTQSTENGLFELYVSPYAKKLKASMDGYIPHVLEIDGSYLVFKLKVDKEYAKRKAAEEEAARVAAEQAKAAEEARIAAEKEAAEKAAAEKAAEEERVRKAAEKEAAEKAKAEADARKAAEKAAAEKAAEEERVRKAAEKEAAAKTKAEERARKAAEKEAAAKAKAEENARKAAETKDTTDAKAEEKNDSTTSKLKKSISAKDNLVTQDTEKEEVFVATYAVGDIYDQNGKNAIVFKTYSRGQHGLALYISQTPCGWKDAKTWCAQLGEGWRLPTPRELQMIYDLKNNGKFNHGLLAAGLRMSWGGHYWSSEEVGDFSAKVVAMNNGNTYDYGQELMSHVCAICKF